MNRFIQLMLIAGLVLLVVVLIARPELLEDIWLWLVGLAGTIVKGVDGLVSYFKKQGGNETPPLPTPAPAASSIQSTPALPASTPTPAFAGITLTLLRYSDDKETTVGLLYINGTFWCYTLEDTFRETKIAGVTRIPAGIYGVDFLQQETLLTLKYRERFPDWFKFHLEIQRVPGFTGIYIHPGGTHEDTKGCVLVSNSLTVSDAKTALMNSRNTYERLYLYLRDELAKGKKVRIDIQNENWFSKRQAS